MRSIQNDTDKIIMIVGTSNPLKKIMIVGTSNFMKQVQDW